MKPLSRESIYLEGFPIHFLIPIYLIPYDRIPDRREMDSDLVCTSCEEIDFEKRILRSYSSSIAKLCFSNFWIHRIICGHLFSIVGISSDEWLYISLLVFHYSDDECEISLLDRSFCDLELERVHRFIIFCDDDKPARILIETMDDTRTFDSIYYWSILLYLSFPCLYHRERSVAIQS